MFDDSKTNGMMRCIGMEPGGGGNRSDCDPFVLIHRALPNTQGRRWSTMVA